MLRFAYVPPDNRYIVYRVFISPLINIWNRGKLPLLLQLTFQNINHNLTTFCQNNVASVGFIEKESCESQVLAPSVVRATNLAFIFSAMKIIVIEVGLFWRLLKGFMGICLCWTFCFYSFKGVLGEHKCESKLLSLERVKVGVKEYYLIRHSFSVRPLLVPRCITLLWLYEEFRVVAR